MQQDHSLEFADTYECLRGEEEDLEERDKRDNIVTVMNESPFLRFLVLTDGQSSRRLRLGSANSWAGGP
jgi:hypothetical protein